MVLTTSTNEKVLIFEVESFLLEPVSGAFLVLYLWRVTFVCRWVHQVSQSDSATFATLPNHWNHMAIFWQCVVYSPEIKWFISENKWPDLSHRTRQFSYLSKIENWVRFMFHVDVPFWSTYVMCQSLAEGWSGSDFCNCRVCRRKKDQLWTIQTKSIISHIPKLTEH